MQFPNRLILSGFLFCSLLWTLPGSVFSYERSQFLNFTLFNLPPEYFAGISLEDRPALFQEFCSDPKSHRIDYEGGYFSHRIPGQTDHDSSYLWLKLLPRDLERKVQNPYSPLIYIHTAKYLEGEGDPNEPKYEYQTKVVMWDRKNETTKWVDVTSKIIPDSVDLSSHLPPQRKYFGIRIEGQGMQKTSLPVKELLIWQDWKFHLRESYPFYSRHTWEAPLDPDRLAILVFRPNRENEETRELAQLIAHAGLLRDERFRGLLEIEELRKEPLLEYALATYEYALDQNEEALDLLLKRVAEEGNGDTNSKWMLSFVDEWDRTLETYHKFRGTDGAAAEANYMFPKQRQYFFPENFEKFWEQKMNEIKARD